ncbi:palmitoyl-protein thioesterase ABHD10, mitochondrial-like [Amphibalanus amphitrite]|uniref:palmitoyl-protein thioesterase ABHD10, mitochondrial-like n=1 Tax=Amphibalanus amphitrite TaxID=1232801 RepID=UPI001C9003C9|nr:palmitoyl-protein thioesterase ABHD10, mitochondrial-like [Amphibalanus amphitrite]
MDGNKRICGIKKSSIFRKNNLVETQFADLGRSEDGDYIRRLAYCKIEGPRRPGLIYVPGYFARMNIAKANILEEFCAMHGHPFVKYDSEGVGQSKMPDSAQLSFKKWYEDACYVMEHLTDGPQMIISSSNGAWMATLLAVNYPERVHSLLLIGSAVNQCLDDDVFENIVSSLDEETAARVRDGKPIRFKANWVGEVTASRHFLDEMKAVRLNEEQLGSIRCPVRIVHAIDDTSSRWENTIQLMEAIGHDDVRIYLKKRGNHRMLDDEDLHLQIRTVEELLENYPVPEGPAGTSRL